MPNPETQFDKYASSYDDLHAQSLRSSGEEAAYFSAYKADYLRRVALKRNLPAHEIIDFGCGIGNAVPHLRRNFPAARIRGMDVSAASIDIARARHQDQSFAVIGDLLPVADDCIDIAMAACVYHHVPPADRAKWTCEIRRSLKPGGSCFIFEHNPFNPLTRKVVADCRFDEDAVLLRARETVGLLKDSGFRHVTLDYIVFFPSGLSVLRRLEPALSWLPFGAQYVAHGRK